MDYLPYIPRELRKYKKDFFAYSVESLGLAAGGAATPNFAVQNDSDFLATHVVGIALNANNVTVAFVNPAVTLEIRDGGSGRLLFNRAFHWNMVVGTAQRPFPLPYPKFIKRASQVDVTFTNLTAGATAQPYDIRVAFHGFKVFEGLEG